MEAAARDLPALFTITADVAPDAGGESAEEDLETPLDLQIGPYLILGKLGMGGMGVVYRARHRTIGQVVALKMMRVGSLHRSDLLDRFQTEAEAIARFEHPNIVRLYSYDQHKGYPYFVMELVEGKSLAKKLKDGVLEYKTAAKLVQTLAYAVGYAHKKGVIHRDLKPGNVLLALDGESNLTPKVADFGLAKLMDVEGPGWTSSDGIMGTPSYMAPEQAEGRPKDIDQRTDVYALGAILYEILAGQPPFLGKNKIETLRLVLEREIVAPSRRRSGVPADLEAVCLKCLEADGTKRYQAAEALADDLGRWLKGEPTLARPLSRLGRVKRWAWRWARAMAVGLFVLGMIGGSVAIYLSTPELRTATEPDPDPLPNDDPREWQSLAKELGGGKPVSLTSTAGRPRWSRWHNPTGSSKVSLLKDGVCSISTAKTGIALLELLPNATTECYRFTAQVRHDSDTSPSDRGRIGLFVGKVIHRRQPKDAHFFIECSLNTVRSLRTDAKQEGTFSAVELRPCFLIDEGPSTDFVEQSPKAIYGPLLQSLGAQNPQWFELTVTVNRQAVRATVKPLDSVQIPNNEAMVITQEWVNQAFAEVPMFARNTAFEGLRPELITHSGLGVIVRNGSGAFRNMRVEALSAQE
jgi:serine/threonine-protein kinase